MLYFVYQELALGYLLFSFLSALGVLQWVAARYRLVGLALWDYRERRRWGYAIGTLLIAGSATWFFASQWARILTPGPAGSELSLLFAFGAAGALILTFASAALLHEVRRRATLREKGDGGSVVAIGSATTGRLYLPSSPGAPVPAVCLVPGLGTGERRALDTLARHLVQQGLAALVIEPDEGLYAYPETLATVPAATSFLSKRPEVDPERLGVLGYDLGADLVMRAASADRQVRTVAALAPILVSPPADLDVLAEMPYPQAFRWTRDRRRAMLRTQLDALAFGARIAPRPFLLLYGAEDKLVSRPPIEEWVRTRGSVTHQVVQGARHLDLMDHPTTLQTVARWFKERL